MQTSTKEYRGETESFSSGTQPSKNDPVEAAILSYLARLHAQIDRLQRSIPVYVDQKLYAQGATTLTLLPQSQNLQLITAALFIVTAAGGATLTIGQTRTIPLPQGNTLYEFGESGWLLSNGDTVTIAQGTAGLLGIELFGRELADKGVF